MKLPITVTNNHNRTRYRVDLAYPVAIVSAFIGLSMFFVDAHWFVAASASAFWFQLAWGVSDNATPVKIEKTKL